MRREYRKHLYKSAYAEFYTLDSFITINYNRETRREINSKYRRSPSFDYVLFIKRNYPDVWEAYVVDETKRRLTG